MANKYNDILTLVNAGNKMGLSNTITRDYGIPLDFTSVQESYDAAVIYAATSTKAYVGQTIAVGGTLYIITETANGTYTIGEGEGATTYDNYLTEVGSKTEGDGNTIELDGQTLKLAGLTNLDSSKTYVPSYVNGKLVWAEPDTSTTDGQAAAIAALDVRVTDLETTINGKDAEGEENTEGYKPAVVGLKDQITNEVAAREAADEALTQAIADALAEAKQYADDNDDDHQYDDSELVERVEALESDVADHETRIAGIELFFEDAAKDEGEGENLKNALDTLVEIQNYITSDGAAADQMVTDINANKAAIEVLNGTGEGSVAKTVADAIEAQAEITDAAINGVSAVAAAAATQTYVDTELAKKANLDLVYTKGEIDSKIGTPGTPEVPAQGTEGEDGYTPKVDAVAGTGIFASAYSKAEVNALLDKVSGGSSETAASVKRQLDTYISENNNRVSNIETKNDTQDSAISAAQAQADKGVSDAAVAKKAAEDAAQAVTNLANGQVNTNKTDIATLTAIVTGSGSDDPSNSHATRIGALESFKTTQTSDFNSLKGRVETNESEIAKKANTTDVYTTTKVDEFLATKADKADTYTKDEVDGKVITSGEVARGDSDIVAIANNKITVTIDAYTKDEVDGLIAAIDYSAINEAIADNAEAIAENASAIATLVGDDAGKSARAIAGEEINALIKAADPENDYVIENITNLVKYVDDNAGDIAQLITDVAANKAAHEANAADIVTINETIDTMEAAIAAIVQPKESAEVSVATDGTLGIKEMNVNKLVQTEGDTLILNGGNAGKKTEAAE